MTAELARQIAERRCPKCKEEGTLQLQLAHASVVCTACMGSFINPFEEGPWDDKDVVLDKMGEKVVSFYQVEEEEDVPDTTLNEAWAEFHRFLYATKKENIEGG